MRPAPDKWQFLSSPTVERISACHSERGLEQTALIKQIDTEV